MMSLILTSSSSLGVIFSSHSATLLESSEICAYFAACAKKFSWEKKENKTYGYILYDNSWMTVSE